MVGEEWVRFSGSPAGDNRKQYTSEPNGIGTGSLAHPPFKPAGRAFEVSSPVLR
jgi:hypothetical protein